MEAAHVKIAVLFRLQKRFVAACELLILHVLGGKGFYNPDARQIVLDLRVDLGNFHPVISESLSHSAVHNVGKSKHKRQNGKCNQRKRRTDGRQNYHSANQLDSRQNYVLGPVVKKLGNVKKVISDPRHKLTDLLVVKI